MSGHVLLFAPRFAPLVESGAKRQTIRGPRKRPVRPGDVLSLRAWEGVPYRSPQRLLRTAACESVAPVLIGGRFNFGLEIEVAGVRLGLQARYRFAKADGFLDVHDMRLWYEDNRAIPFEGVLIRWDP